MPPVLYAIRQTAKKTLNELLQGMFTSADDALFEMADRSRNDADQTMFFESMRQIRLKRKAISQHFISRFYRGFEITVEPEAAPQDEPDDFDAAVDSISLVQNDELEVSVAMSGIVSKVTSQFSLPIMQLTKRIDRLCEDRTITERANPLGPFVISQAFVTAMDELDVDIKIRIIVLKLFERYVMERLEPIYNEANRRLVEAGVLPDLRNVLKPHPRSQSPVSGRPGQATGETNPVDDAQGRATSFDLGFGRAEFGALQRLLAQTRGTQDVAPVPSGPVIATPDLMDVLTALQSDPSKQAELDRLPAHIDLRQLVLASASSAGKASNLRQADDDVVNLVGMLFDYILNDRNLAIPMKALISRLQIPVLKVAVLDKSFFSKTSHPARQLLNELSSAGIGWSSSAELKRDAMYDLIESIVLRVLDNFDDDMRVFTKLVNELRQFVVRDKRKTTLVEQRVKDAENGKATTQAARATVQRLINQKAAGLRLPPEMGRFVSDTWSKVLVYACVKHGPDAAEWQRVVHTLDDLLWCVQPLTTAEDIERLDQITPHLLERLEEGMATIKLPTADIAGSITTMACVLSEIAANDCQYLDVGRGPEQDDTFEVLEEIVLTECEPAPPIEIHAQPECLRQIERLTEGSWVELADDKGASMRCRLATIVQPGDRYIFVNRRGMKIAERSKLALAAELERETLVVLDESQVFDRALQAVIGNLRNIHRESTS